MKTVVAYTDGACSGNPGPGGWGAVLLFGVHQKELSGFDAETTNNRMELTAAIQALAALKEPCIVKLYSDSAYLINAFTLHWIDKWQANNWHKSNKDPVENAELWKRLIQLSKIHQVEWIKVKGHADVEYNNLADQLARSAIQHGRNA